MRTKNGRVLFIDFDYTLFGSNSTELFLLHARPRWFVSLLIALVRDLEPWRLIYWARFQRFRDYVLVMLTILLSPWNLWRWRRDAPTLFAAYTTHPLARALADQPTDRTVIVSFGFEVVIRPLLRDSPWHACSLVSTPVLAGKLWFANGKTVLVRHAGFDREIASAAFITDSEADADLLAAVEDGSLIERTGPLIDAGDVLYFPLRYAARAKFSPEYVREQALFVDLAVVLLATATALAPAALLAVPVLFLSLMCVYEIGYFENDMKASRLEETPKVTPAMERFRNLRLSYYAWWWAGVLGLAGCALAWWSLSGAGASLHELAWLLLFWGVALMCSRWLFWLYNRQPAAVRPRLYLGLQFAKYLPIPLLFGLALPGMILVLAQGFAMWARYLAYRVGGDAAMFRIEEVRLIVLVSVSGGIVVTLGAGVLHLPWLGAIVAWSVWRVVGKRCAGVLRAFRPTQRAKGES